MKRSLFSLFVALIISLTASAQVGIGTNTPDASALLHLNSTTKGVLMPKLNSGQIAGIVSPAAGLIVYNTTVNCLQINIGTSGAPDFQCLGIRNDAEWLDTTIGGKAYLFANRAMDHGDTVIVTEDGRLLVGSFGSGIPSSVKFAVTPNQFVIGNAFGPGINFTNAIIFDEKADYDSTHQVNYSNVMGVVWTPTVDHIQVSGSVMGLIVKGSANITGSISGSTSGTNSISSGTLEQIADHVSSMRNFGPGTINNARNITMQLAAHSGTIINGVGLHIDAVIPAGGDIQNSYGIMINNQIQGSASAYALYSLSDAHSMFTGNVGIGDTPDSSAILDLTSTSKGFLMPRMTATHIGNIDDPAQGLLVYNTTIGSLQINNGTPSAPNFESFGSRDWADTTINGIDAIFAKRAMRVNGDTMLITDDGRLLIGSSANHNLPSSLRLAILPKNFSGILPSGIGTVHPQNSLIFGEVENFPIPADINYGNMLGMNFNPTVDHPNLTGANVAGLNIGGSQNITGPLLNNVSGIMNTNTGDLTEIMDNYSNVINMSTGHIENATAFQGTVANYTGTLTNAFAFRVGGVQGAVNGYGVYIPDSLYNNTNSYAVFSNSPVNSYFKGYIGVNTAAPKSSQDIAGSLGTAINTTSSNITLDSSHHTIILTSGTPSVTFPAAADCPRRTYIIVNNTGGPCTISTYVNIGGGSSTTLTANKSHTFQSDGTSWYLISAGN